MVFKARVYSKEARGKRKRMRRSEMICIGILYRYVRNDRINFYRYRRECVVSNSNITSLPRENESKNQKLRDRKGLRKRGKEKGLGNEVG